jgi:hypothetical protein
MIGELTHALKDALNRRFFRGSIIQGVLKQFHARLRNFR